MTTRDTQPNLDLSRRKLLAGAATAASVAQIRTVTGQSIHAAVPATAVPEDPTKRPGPLPGPLGKRSPFEHPVRKPSDISSRSPLQDLYGMITPSDLHFERHHAGIPAIDPARYELLIHGMVERPTIFNLADLLYKNGDVRHASLFIETAIGNAEFYGARQRKVQVSSILSLIEGEKINAVESQRGLLIRYSVVVTLLMIVLAILIVIIRQQVRKLKKAQQMITEAHAAQQLINEKLEEANKIKEEYIGYFFSLDSEFFVKLERLKRTLDQKISERKLEDIRFIVNNIQPKKEKEELLKSFDTVFLKIFPHFVTKFNSLFKEEDQIHLKENEPLNIDLRIFALIRMGISDNDKIAQILGYSVNTVYAYKTRIKNRSNIPNEEFEARIKSI